ncbi:MAG: ABC transporter ATP-binding protein [Alphaproteobacteria bacterium]
MAAAAAPFMQAEGLARVYAMGGSEVRALDGVDAAIAHGEFVAVMGPSGSGKSTFMNLLGLLDQPSAGRYRLDGEDVAGLDADARAALRNRKLGFVFQSFNLLARATAVDNVALPLVYGGVGRRERRARAARILERLGLGERLDHAPQELSGGQQQRVAIARAMVNEPGAILADEPTGALDSRTGLGIMALFQELNAQGITIVVVTHDPEVAAFASRVLLFRDGRLVEDRRQAPRDARAAIAAAGAP